MHYLWDPLPMVRTPRLACRWPWHPATAPLAGTTEVAHQASLAFVGDDVPFGSRRVQSHKLAKFHIPDPSSQPNDWPNVPFVILRHFVRFFDQFFGRCTRFDPGFGSVFWLESRKSAKIPRQTGAIWTISYYTSNARFPDHFFSSIIPFKYTGLQESPFYGWYFLTSHTMWSRKLVPWMGFLEKAYQVHRMVSLSVMTRFVSFPGPGSTSFGDFSHILTKIPYP